MKNIKLLHLSIITFSFFMLAGASCLEGLTGSEGEPGPPGTANVIYSEWMDFDWNIADETTFKSMFIE